MPRATNIIKMIPNILHNIGGSVVKQHPVGGFVDASGLNNTFKIFESSSCWFITSFKCYRHLISVQNRSSSFITNGITITVDNTIYKG